jgi:hypothetical protein
VKYCIIRRVPFKWPAKKSRIVWAHVLAEYEGLALVLVPKTDTTSPHSIFIAQEDITERIFEPISPHRFDLETAGVAEAGDKLRMLGKAFMAQEFNGLFDFGDLF